MDVQKEIRRAVDTGIVAFGQREAEKSILKGKATLIVISKNATLAARERILNLCKINEIPHYDFKGIGLELGSVCGKPFVISMLGIEKPGKSKILKELAKKQ